MAYNAPVINRILRAVAPGVWLVVFLLAFAGPIAAFAEDTTVLVFPFENQTDESGVDWLGEGIAELMNERLGAEASLHVFTRDERLALFRKAGIPRRAAITRASAIQLGWDAGADIVVLGTMSGGGADFSIQARLIDLDGLRVFDGARTSGKLDDVPTLASTLAGQLSSKIAGEGGAGQSPRALPPPSAFEKYIRGLLSEDPAVRIAYLKDAVRLHPEYRQAIFELGRTYHAAREYRLSRQWFDRVGADWPEYQEARFLQGVNAYHLGDYDAAATIFASLPARHGTLMNLGAALSRKRDPAAAVSAWRRAAELDGLISDTFFNLGYVSLTAGDIGGAIRYLEQFRKLEGRDGEALFILGRSYERAGRAEDGQREITAATRLSPRVERWSAQIPGDLERLSNEVPPTIRRPGLPNNIWSDRRLARRAASQNLASLLSTVSRQIDTEFYGAAIRQVQEILTLFPKSAEAHETLARVYELQREYPLAIRELQSAVSIEPSVGSYVTLARIYRTINQADQASEAVDRALKLDPGNPLASGLKVELERAAVPRPARRTQ
jgi:tetratricopeptide (TPR) repeat protein/TolB-like protein